MLFIGNKVKINPDRAVSYALRDDLDYYKIHSRKIGKITRMHYNKNLKNLEYVIVTFNKNPRINLAVGYADIKNNTLILLPQLRKHPLTKIFK